MSLIRRLLPARNRNIILAIESSCDDTCLAIMNTNNQIIYEYKYSQKKLHQPFGGVVPQLAALGHRTSFLKILEQGLVHKYLRSNCIKFIAVTTGPGIGSCLNIGYEIACQLSRSYEFPMIPINHLVNRKLN